MAYGIGMEEISGKNQGRGLSQTLQSIVSVVRQARDEEPQSVSREREMSDAQLKKLFESDLRKETVRAEGVEAQEAMDLKSIRAALYGA